jgi:hypothetical protein
VRHYNARNDPLANATRKLVVWTRVLAGAAVVSLIVAGVSLCAAFLQWGALRRADDTTREAFTAVQRAFVTVGDLAIAPVVGDQGKTDLWQVTPIIENSGNTPTKNLRYLFSTSIADAKYFKDAPYINLVCAGGIPISNLVPDFNHVVIGPKSKLPTTFFNAPGVSSGTVEQVRAGNSFVIVQGVIRYDDILSDTAHHITRSCFLFDRRQTIIKPDDPLSFSMCSLYNCADEECEREERERPERLIKLGKPWTDECH